MGGRGMMGVTRPAAFWLGVATLFLALTVSLGFSHPAQAHSKSLSFSDWHWAGNTVTVSFTTPARDVTLLQQVQNAVDLGSALAAHVSAHLRLMQIKTPCQLQTPFAPSEARAGYIRVIGQYRCYDEETIITIDNHAFFNLARTHVHFARLGLAEEKLSDSTEVLFTATQRRHHVKPGPDGRLTKQNDFAETLGNYFWLGVTHILTGYDHLAFVVCLLLLANTKKRAIWLVSGFTIGHSLTLALAALGWIVPNGAVVEAMIGASIALVAAETILARKGRMPRFGAVMAGLLFITSGLAIFINSALPLGAWVGMMLFILCYGAVMTTPQDTQRLAPVTTGAFGLVHGFGFAGLLADIGLPTGNLLVGLISFNLGVEAGQLLVLLPLLFFGPILLEELPDIGASWRDIIAAALTAFGTYLFVARALF